ncbi:radical SAM/SPASM domain-containing protein [Thermotalea metallivorans]|uniref:Antilisterial bacteriocin subtilosin biosynthesis protein AlbA n=1 Tax=Thermotalea metallivorans TaxID=520762 RepID=A0A140L8K0_9FIRM|nr:radical SAM protein [Thermotalea metallivorans]KXG76875.1 Antilisterial bacteriocin subtilosin biosynthesis protein AlbA [Thermotalea metallivorans]
MIKSLHNDERKWYNIFNSYYNLKIRELYKKEIKYPFNPIYVGLKITEKCNQRCKHCWSGKSSFEPSYEQIEKAIQKIKSFDIYHFTITGGEPFLREDCFDIIELAKRNFPVVEVFTNAELLTSKDIDKLSLILGKDDFLQVSLDGLEQTYKAQRGVDGYEKVIKNVELLIKKGINVRVHMTVSKYNESDIFPVYKKCLLLDCHTFSITFVYPLRKGCIIRDETSFDIYEQSIKNISNHHNAGNYKMFIRPFVPIEIQSKYARYKVNKDFIFFNENILHWVIDANGEIYNFMDHIKHKDLRIGNIYNDDIETIKKTNLNVQRKILFRNLNNEKCSKCSLLDSCHGGNYIDNYPDMNKPDRRCKADV